MGTALLGISVSFDGTILELTRQFFVRVNLGGVESFCSWSRGFTVLKQQFVSPN
jgi:hypothetical protein